MTAQEQAENLHVVAEDITRKIYGPDERNWPDGLCNSIDDALRAARNEAIEECAKVALSYELPDTGPQDQYGRVMASLQITSAIRALKG